MECAMRWRGPDTSCALLRAGLNPLEVVEKLRELCSSLTVVEGDDALSQEAQRNATLIFMCLLRSMLASKRVLREYRLNSEAFSWLVGEIGTRFRLVRVASFRARAAFLLVVDLTSIPPS
jgi:RNA polymerase Rpb1, domain 6